jgi:hypothetical protein
METCKESPERFLIDIDEEDEGRENPHQLDDERVRLGD